MAASSVARTPPDVGRRTFLARALAALTGASILGRARPAGAAPRDIEPYIGEIRMFGGTFAPNGWYLCNGQLIPIVQNTALFSILGTTYGGNGTSTFALPDLRGRVPIGAGQGNGLNLRARGEQGGVEAHPLILPEIPSHTHTWRASTSNGSSDNPSGGALARSPAGIPQFGFGHDTFLAVDAIGNAGSGVAHANMQPFLTLTYIIAYSGVFPPHP